MTFSQAVRRLARQKQISLGEVGRRMGLRADGEIQSRLNYDYPRFKTMQKMANALDMKVWEILKFAEEN